jgi:hypothetical protein
MFFQALFLISILPYLVFPLVFSGAIAPSTEAVKQTILFLANAHIAITLYFYYDKRFGAIMGANRNRYILGPLGAVFLSAISYALTPDRYAFVWWALYALWQNWHFGRQTFGVYAIVTLDQTPGTKISQFERAAIYTTVAAGSAGSLFMFTGDSAFHQMALQVRAICGYTTVLALIVGVGRLAYARASFNLNRALFFIFSLLFFAPQYIHLTPAIGFTPYSVSHSMQYLFFMAVVAFNAHERPALADSQLPPGLSLFLLFGGIVLVGGSIMTIRGDFGVGLAKITGSAMLGKFVSGAMFGLVIAHFIIDAHAWRLRERPQREFVLDRFDFLGKARSLAASQAAS